MLLLLSGIGLDELIKLRWSDVDLPGGTIYVRDGAMRAVALHEPLRGILDARCAERGSDSLIGTPDRPATPEGIGTQILYAAHDAGIEGAMEVTPACLRHTYIAFLVRQGIRFSDLTQVVGALAPETLGVYSALSPRGPRVPREAIDLVLPALRDPNLAATVGVSPPPPGAQPG
jgi:polysaccharide biosynthesis transport protein